MRKAWLGQLVVTVLVLIPGTAHAIVSGQPDGARHPYVGMVFQEDDAGTGTFAACSGALISPRVFLTAGHCTALFATGIQPVQLTFAEDGTDFVGQATGTVHTYPGFCGGCGGAWGRNVGDIGVVVLDGALELPQYGQLPAVGAADGLALKSVITHVGYGVRTGQDGCVFYRCLPGDFGVRYRASSELLSAGALSTEFVKTSQHDGGTCFGDSGGPALVGDGPTVLAVHSYVTDWSCASVSYATRIDQGAVLSWIQSWM